MTEAVRAFMELGRRLGVRIVRADTKADNLKSQNVLKKCGFVFLFHALEEEMATHSRIVAWRMPGTEEPGGLPSMGLHRVGHD